MPTAYNLLDSISMYKKSLVLLLCIMVTVYSQCPANCTTCSNPTSCSACRAGSFVVNNTFCAPCPPDCSACRVGADGRPVCTACTAPAQLGGNGQCFRCDPSCQSCAVSPRNCTACRDGQQLATVNSTGSCGSIAGCPIENCGECTPPDQRNMTFCDRCLPGYFPFMQKCFPCKFPCAACDWDREAIWLNISGTWDQAIRRALNLSAGPPAPGTLPPFLNGLDFANMTNDTRRGWIQAFLLTKLAAPVYPTPEALIASIPQHIQFLGSLQNMTEADQQLAILRRVNQVLGKNWTLFEFGNKTAQIAAGLTNCAQCGAGFQANNTVGQCQACSVGCTTCNGTCSACQDGFFLSAGACQRCTPPCATCSSSATTCTRCVPPTSLVAGACVLCQQPCATCLSANTSSCTTCKRPFSLTAASGACFRCDEDLCVECQPANTTICLQCKPGATLVNGRCQFCPANCSTCSTGSAAAPPVCFTCLAGFQLTTVGNDTRCLPCGPGCVRCSDGTCLECQTGTFLNSANATCMKCKQGCKQCTGLEACTLFESGMVIISGNVVTCRPGCQVCDSTSPDVCTQCAERYFLDSGVCRQCGPGCAACSSPTVCTRCLDNLHLAAGNCSQCAGNCRTCNNANLSSCVTCKRGFTLVGTACVNQCERGCLECDATNSSICLTCQQGHSLRPDGRCIKCLGSCSGSCDPRNISICLTCVDGFELKDNQCIRCPLGCATCLHGECSACVPGFNLNQIANGSFVCAEKCRPPCTSCSNGACFACEQGFTFTNGQCNPDLSCNPNCEFCPAGTYKNASSSCVPCPQSCASCPSGTCVECQKGFFLANSTCQRCPDKCRTCYNADTCEDCAPGFIKEILSMGTNGIADATFSDNCIPCAPNCRTCAVEPDRCTSCPEGSRLFSFRCSGMFTVQYTYELNINYTTFLANSESQNFVQTLSNLTNVNSTDNYIIFVREGSTVIGGSISTSSQAQATSLQSNMGTTVPGYTVLSSSASVYYGDAQYTAPEEAKANNQTTNVGLIVGVVVGGVALIAIVSFLIYKFKIKKQQTSIKEEDTDIIVKQQQ